MREPCRQLTHCLKSNLLASKDLPRAEPVGYAGWGCCLSLRPRIEKCLGQDKFLPALPPTSGRALCLTGTYRVPKIQAARALASLPKFLHLNYLAENSARRKP